jgi:large subunit ribosomal protein L25
MESVAIQAEVRENLGKQSSSQARRNGMIPSVIYSEKGNIHVTCDPASFKKLVYTSDFRIAEITVNGDTHKCILKDIQFHPVTDEILHADFQKLIEGAAIKTNIPLRIKGVSPGVKAGGKLQKLLRKVKIKANPDQLINEVFVDITGLGLGQSKRVSDIEIPEGIEVMNSPSIPVVTIEIPRALRSAASKEAKVGEKKK